MADDTTMHFCPYCGGKFGTFERPFQFCPHCGEKLPVSVSPGSATNPIPNSSPPPACKVENRENPVDVGTESREFFAKLKNKLRSSAMNGEMIDTPGSKAVLSLYRFNHYSIVLKSCSDKERLARRLEKILLRSYAAIRLAVERIPCIAVYKGKVDTMLQVVQALKAEKAAISIIIGDFDTALALEKIFPGFADYPTADRQAIQAIPHYCWLGDEIVSVISDVYLERLGENHHGVFVITNQGLYFVYMDVLTHDYHWMIIPYYLVRTAVVRADLYYDGLLIQYNDGRNEDIFIMPDEHHMLQAQSAVERFLGKDAFIVEIESVCDHCGYTQRQTLDDTPMGDCSKCGCRLSKTVLKYG